MKRVFLIVLDSFGIGQMPDSEAFGDVNVNTLASCAASGVLNIPNMVLISLVALVLDHYVAPDAKRCYICIPVFSAITFGLLPYCAAFVVPMEALKLAVVGAVVFTITTWLFTTIQERLSSGPAAKASAFFSAVSLYMASQCFIGMIL